MQSVKKWDDFGTEEIIPMNDAVNELLFFNHKNEATEEQRQETISRLQQGFQMNTDKVHYKAINPVKDLLDNIDDDIDLNEEN
jgi:hypothetical protein